MIKCLKNLIIASISIPITSAALVAPILIVNAVNHDSKEIKENKFEVTNDPKYEQINQYFKSQSLSLLFGEKSSHITYNGSQGTAWLLPNQYEFILNQINSSAIKNISFYISTNVHVINNIYGRFENLFLSLFQKPTDNEILYGINSKLFINKSNVELVDFKYFIRNENTKDWPLKKYNVSYKVKFWQSTFIDNSKEYDQDNSKPWKYIRKSYNDLCVLKLTVSKEPINKIIIDWLHYGANYQAKFLNNNIVENNNNQSYFIGGFVGCDNNLLDWRLMRYSFYEQNKKNDPVYGSSYEPSNYSIFWNSDELKLDIMIDGYIYNGTYKDTSKQIIFKDLDIGLGSSGSLILAVDNNNFSSFSYAGIWWGNYSDVDKNIVFGAGNLLKTNDFYPNKLYFPDLIWKGYDFLEKFKMIINSNY